MKLTQKQTQAIDILEDDETTELLFGGAAGGAKSTLGGYWLSKQCIKYPETRWLMGRAILKTLKETTLVTLFDVFKRQKLVKDVHYKLNLGSNTITYWNGSQILLKDLFQYPSDPNFDELGSLEISGAFVDEASQISEKCKEILKSRIRYKLDENNLMPKLLLTCNPAKNWTYNQFYKPWKDGKLDPNKKFIQSLAKDNPNISRHYLKNLETLDKVSKERLLFGNWEYDNDPAKLIEFDNILNIYTNAHRINGKKYISADIARFGSDRTVILVWNGLEVIKYLIIDKSDTMDVITKIRSLCQEHQVPMSQVIVDEDGVGGGVVDNLRCRGFVNNSKPIGKKNFGNLKSQCYYKLADYINADKITWPVIDIETKASLTEELEYVKTKDADADGKQYVLSKKQVKEYINRSPDISDAAMLRMWFELLSFGGIKSKTH